MGTARIMSMSVGVGRRWVMIAAVAGAGTQGGALAGPLAPERPLLVHHGSSSRPWDFAGDPARLAHIDSLPFSGFAYNLPATWSTMRPYLGKPFTEAELHDQFGGLDHSFSNLTENWVSVVVRRRGEGAVGDFFDDAAWSETVEDFRRLARVAATPRYQCVGLVFDDEEYFEDVWNYPDDVAFSLVQGLEAYRAKARERGREVMDAVLEEWPEARVIVLHGPYRSAPEPRPHEVSMDQVGSWTQCELAGPFFIGMVEAAPAGRVSDGGEVYQLRSRRDFAINTSWRRDEMGQSEIIPAELGSVWSERVGVVHGLYNQSWPTPEDVMSPAVMTGALEQALRQGDDGTWLFIESGESWMDPGGFPTQWRQAIETAVSAASAPECPGDVNGDGVVTAADLSEMLSAWGNTAGFGPADRDLDGSVGTADLAVLLASWGACP